MSEEMKIKSKPWYVRLIEYTILFLILASLVYGISKSSVTFWVDENSVVKNALDYCKNNYYMLDMKKEPQQAKAELMTCGEVKEKTIMKECDDRNPDSKMWFVSTDGLWFLYGPVVDKTPVIPTQLNVCYVLINGWTGQRLEIRYSE